MEPLRVLIADDEPKIRKGLRSAVDWPSLGMEVAGEAEDGETALQKALALRPDLMLVDICMPFLGGLDLIGRLREALPGCLVIVVTGHDEFAYAQQAVRLNVFDYILKPIQGAQLRDVLRMAGENLTAARRESAYTRWASRQLQQNMPYIRERFWNDWVCGRLTGAEIGEQLAFFGLEVAPDSGMLLLKADLSGTGEGDWRRRLLAAQGVIAEELPAAWGPIVFLDGLNRVAAIFPMPDPDAWHTLAASLAEAVMERLALRVRILQTPVKGGLEGVPEAYQQLLEEISREKTRAPMVDLCKAYIDTHYFEETLSLQDVAGSLGISPGYLSRLMRRELGLSFIDYLIRVRIGKAEELLRDPFAKIGDIAARAGYRSQHYFSTAFKKKNGVSPAEYRKGVL
ncbi:MAG: response regulator [Clostridia bacterium]|nr:response regulator [Clostridia bacterium]